MLIGNSGCSVHHLARRAPLALPPKPALRYNMKLKLNFIFKIN